MFSVRIRAPSWLNYSECAEFEPLNVLVVSSKYPPEYSGSGLRAHNTYIRLNQKYGISFEVICSSTQSNEAKSYEIDEVRVERIVSKRLRNINQKLARTKLRRAPNALMAHIEARSVRQALETRSFDLIHTFGYSPATAAAIRWSRENNKPLIVELVNANAIPYQYLPGSRFISSYELNTRSAIVAISKHLADVSKAQGLESNVWTRPNPVELERFRIASEHDRQTARNIVAPAQNNRKLVVYVAKFLTRKNHTFLIDVLAKLSDEYHLVLAGPPLTDRDLVPGLRKNEISTLVERAEVLGVADRLTVVPGFVVMETYLAAADVFCFPAEQEGMGTPLLESIAAGVPVVANRDESSFVEWITEGENGYLRPLDAQLWAEAVVRASKFEHSQNRKNSDKIKSTISTDSIDANYAKILSALTSSSKGQKIDISEILAT